MKIVYYDNNKPKDQPGFRGGGTAWWVRFESDQSSEEHFGEFDISENLYWALFYLGIIDSFNKLPNDGFIDAYETGILFSSGLKEAAEILYKKVQTLTENKYQWRCSQQISPDDVEYRIIVDSSILKSQLKAFGEFFSKGLSKGFDVQLWL